MYWSVGKEGYSFSDEDVLAFIEYGDSKHLRDDWMQEGKMMTPVQFVEKNGLLNCWRSVHEAMCSFSREIENTCYKIQKIAWEQFLADNKGKEEYKDDFSRAFSMKESQLYEEIVKGRMYVADKKTLESRAEKIRPELREFTIMKRTLRSYIDEGMEHARKNGKWVMHEYGVGFAAGRIETIVSLISKNELEIVEGVFDVDERSSLYQILMGKWVHEYSKLRNKNEKEEYILKMMEYYRET